MPVSLLAHIIVTRAVSSRIASRKSFNSMRPSLLTGSSVISISGIIDLANKMIAECSTDVVTMCRFSELFFNAEKIAVLSDSVPQDVKMISSAFEFINCATWFRA